MKILFTGAFGNIGSYALAELLRLGHTVRVFEARTLANQQKARHFSDQIELVWGDIRRQEELEPHVQDCDVVIHMAYIIPPQSEENIQLAEAVNVFGTQNIIAACQRAPKAPKLLFTSSGEVFGRTMHKPPPRNSDEPLVETSHYTRHKVQCETLVRQSGLTWMIIRFAGVIAISLARTHPLMFEIPLNNRFEVTHPSDAGTAVARAISEPTLWGKVVLIGGGPRCQMTYGDFLNGMLTALGVGPLPAEAFTDRPYPGDWFDTRESQALLNYQKHTLADIQREIVALMGWRRYIMPLARPFARRAILKLSPYWMSYEKGRA